MPHVRMVIKVFSVGYLRDQPGQSKGGFWTVEYYQPYFDVDTKTVCPLSSHWIILLTCLVLRYWRDAMQHFSQRRQITYRST